MRFTRESLSKLKYNVSGPETQQVWGTGLDKNLGVALSPRGDHVWITRVYVALPNKRAKRRIGRLFRRPLNLQDRSIDEARRERDVWKLEAAEGVDPIEKRRPIGGKEGAEAAEGPPTVAILLDTYLREYVARELEPATLRRYQGLLRHILGDLGAVQIADLDKARLLAVRRKLSDKRETFNQVRKLISAAYRCADRLGWTWGGLPMVPEGFFPVAAVPAYELAGGKRGGDPFAPDELERILAVVLDHLRPERDRHHREIGRGPVALSAFLLFTGLRQNEGVGLTWERLDLPKASGWRGWIDRRKNEIHLVHHKTSRKTRARVVPLSPQAVRILDAIEGDDPTWVFPSQLGGRIKQLDPTWRRLLRRAGVRVRGLHQTRHTFITRALEAGAPLAAVAKAVGHSSTYITDQYSHVCDSAARKAAELASNEIRPIAPAEFAQVQGSL